MTTTTLASVETTFSATRCARKWQSGDLSFYLFVILNIVLLLRPQEIYPRLEVLHPYELTMLACLASCWPRILRKLRWGELKRAPITVCVLGLAPAITLAILWQSRLDMVEEYAVEYVKIALYYLVLVAVVDSPRKLKLLCLSLATVIGAISAVAVLSYHQVIELETLQKLVDVRSDMENGGLVRFDRLQAVGIFRDPNDLAQILAVGVLFCIYGWERSSRLLMRLLWPALMALMLYGIYRTQSRGGLLALLAGAGALAICRLGLRRASIAGAVAIPLLLVAFGGRQTDLSTADGSTLSRVQLWSDALEALRGNPLLGIGPGGMEEQSGQVAHNSFLQAYAEWGIPGGWLFFTAYWVAIWGVSRMGQRTVRVLDEELAHLTPYLTAALVAYCAGMLSLTRNYVSPTYLMLGLASSYLTLVLTDPPKPQIRFGLRLLGRTFAWSILFLLALQLFVKASVRWGE